MYRATLGLVGINVFLGVLAAVALSYSIFMVATDGTLCLDCLAVPTIWGWAIFGLTLSMVVVSIWAIVAAVKHVKSMLICHAILTLALFAACLALTVISLMWSTNTDLGALQGTVASLEDGFGSYMVLYAHTRPDQWERIQDSFECCGVNLKATYQIGYDFENELHTGSACNSTVDQYIGSVQIASGVATWDDMTPAEEAAQNAAIISFNGGHSYFCYNTFKSEAQTYILYAGIALAILSAVELAVLVLTFILLCRVKEEEGGFAAVDEETGEIESPMKAMFSAPAEVAHDTRAFANRVSTRVGMSVAPVANRVSTRMGFSPVFSGGGQGGFTPLGAPPPGLPPPGMGGPPANPVAAREMAAGGGGGAFGPEYDKYKKMLKSGLPEGAVRNAFARDQVEIPDGFFETFSGGGGGDDAPPAPKARGGPPAGPPPFQAMRNFANRISTNVSKATNRVSMNIRGGLGGTFAPPPPPPGFGELPADGTGGVGTSSSFGAPTTNPTFMGGPPPGFSSARTVPEESLPALPAPAPAKKAPPPKKEPAPKKEPPPKKEPAPKKEAAPKKAPAAKKAGGGGGGGSPGFLADISGHSGGPKAFGLKKTVTNDRSAPNFNA